jgi:predicted nucleic acid-binding protein
MNLSIIDTDILSAFMRDNQAVVNKIDEHLQEYGFVNISIITYYEILNGLLYKDAKKQLARFNEFVSLNRVVPLTMKSSKLSAEIFAELRKKGKEIGHTDTLIAGIAIANDLQLITNNTDHFKRIKSLRIDNWML